MSSLVITKQSLNFFSLVIDGGSPIISEQNRLTTFGDYCNFKTENGANLILKQNILYSEITIVDGTSHIPTSINDLWVSLIDVGFFNGVVGGVGGSGANEFTELSDTFTSFVGRDGQVLIVNESQQRIETIGISIFSQSDRDKLDGIETKAQVNVKTDWNETDPNSDAYLLNKPDFLDNSIQIIDYPELTVDGIQDFTIPSGKTAVQVFLNDAIQYTQTANNTSRGNTFTQSGAVVTLQQPTEINNYITIYYK